MILKWDWAFKHFLCKITGLTHVPPRLCSWLGAMRADGSSHLAQALDAARRDSGQTESTAIANSVRNATWGASVVRGPSAPLAIDFSCSESLGFCHLCTEEYCQLVWCDLKAPKIELGSECWSTGQGLLCVPVSCKTRLGLVCVMVIDPSWTDRRTGSTWRRSRARAHSVGKWQHWMSELGLGCS